MASWIEDAARLAAAAGFRADDASRQALLDEEGSRGRSSHRLAQALQEKAALRHIQAARGCLAVGVKAQAEFHKSMATRHAKAAHDEFKAAQR